jgi:hypothetical protein
MFSLIQTFLLIMVIFFLFFIKKNTVNFVLVSEEFLRLLLKFTLQLGPMGNAANLNFS